MAKSLPHLTRYFLRHSTASARTGAAAAETGLCLGLESVAWFGRVQTHLVSRGAQTDLKKGKIPTVNIKQYKDWALSSIFLRFHATLHLLEIHLDIPTQLDIFCRWCQELFDHIFCACNSIIHCPIGNCVSTHGQQLVEDG